MRAGWERVALGVAVGLALAAPAAHAEVTGSFDGQLTGKKLPQTVAAALAMTQVGKAVTGTLALGGSPAAFAGAFLVQGSATTRKLKLVGLNNGVTLKWQGKIGGDTIQGKARLKGPATKIAGTLAFTRNVSTSDGSACDAVFTQNQMLFVDQVLGQALTTCATCHVTGGQAQAARFRITPGDPLATARSVALFVDSANPSASRILQKPLDLVPHGGVQQLIAGSPQEQILTDWVGRVAQAHCN
jgi:hypothetical protein